LKVVDGRRVGDVGDLWTVGVLLAGSGVANGDWVLEAVGGRRVGDVAIAGVGNLRGADGGVALEGVEGVAFARLADDFHFASDLVFVGAGALKCAGVGERRIWGV
jgi:hypothetical protein